jgi:hypothetical protein
MPDDFNLLNCHVQGRVALIILVIEYQDPTQEVNQTYLCLAVARPMHRSIAAVVSNPQIHAELFEKVQTYWLVSLSSNMHNIDAHIV